ncbi:hypothetical protein [Pseudomonas sp. RIT-PI-AD]|uniref:hypothetical protein n=1 Tax=Pseudomonas sp. RIT-PI-AD TaxID=3035294 RepID=UPI0021DABA24|nr:hypothetical protein [Pseudomonas sp. RIT-PI-AD]
MRWLAAALGCAASAVAAVVYLAEADPAPAPPAVAAVPRGAPLAEAGTWSPPPAPRVSRPALPAPTAKVAETDSPPGLDAEAAQVLMQVMIERGDPRSPALGGLRPRRPATAATLADPQAYAAFQADEERRQAQAYIAGVQQIPAIRARIEDAAQGGERSAAELDEARGALQQLEMLRDSLRTQAPELLSEPPAP